MVIVKEIIIILGIFIYIAVGLIIKIPFLFILPSIRFRIISQWTRVCNRFLRFMLRIKVIVEGDYSRLSERGNFIVSNHLSYLDGVILGSLFPVIYVSKSEVLKWPLFGWMTMTGDTIFIDRKRRFKSVDFVQEASLMLKRKVNVLVFPEGTSTDGEKLLPFQAIHFQPPLNARCSILPVVINYTKINKEEVNLNNRDKVCWYGQVKFYQHLLRALELGNIEARVVIYPKIDLANPSNSGYSRKDLSFAIHKVISNNYPLFH